MGSQIIFTPCHQPAVNTTSGNRVFQASAFCFTGQKKGERGQWAFDSITKHLLQLVAEGNILVLASMFCNAGLYLVGCKPVCSRNRVFGFHSPGRNKPNERFCIHTAVLRTEKTITSWWMLGDGELSTCVATSSRSAPECRSTPMPTPHQELVGVTKQNKKTH